MFWQDHSISLRSLGAFHNLAALLQLLLHLLSWEVDVDGEVGGQEFTDADAFDLIVVLHTCEPHDTNVVKCFCVPHQTQIWQIFWQFFLQKHVGGFFWGGVIRQQRSILTLFPDVSLFKHGLQEDHITEGRTLQDDSLTLSIDDILLKHSPSYHMYTHFCQLLQK